MDKYGLLGGKLSHSFSPMIHNLLDTYEYSLYPAEDLSLFMHDLTLGQLRQLKGFNVTIPYKEKIIPYLDEISTAAQKIGSVNTVVKREDGTLFGDNTDYYGFEETVKDFELNGKKALVLGSGGASKAVAALLQDKGALVTIISRNGENNYGNLHIHYDADIVVNTTPVGMYPDIDACPLSLEHFKKCVLVVDLIYNPYRTRLLLQAEDLGIEARNGLLMLVAQAKAASQIFTGKTLPDSLIYEIKGKIEGITSNIILVGMPGAGKTTIASLLDENYIDTDKLIEDTLGKSPAEIIETEGEAQFRIIESRILSDALSESGRVVATGGGIVTVPENITKIRQSGICIFIKRPLEALAVGRRPLSQKKGVEVLYQERLPLYMRACDFEIENIVLEDAVNAIKERISI